MTVIRALALFLTVAAAGTLLNASGPAAGAPPMGGVRLKRISARVHARGASLVIEATEPAAYIATEPDPLTVLVEFRNAIADGVANSFVATPKSPIVSVAVEPSEWLGTPASRVRVVLAQPVAHHVRSDRNAVVVDFDRPVNAAPTRAAAPPRVAPDAMLALTATSERPPIDVLTALGLGAGVGATSQPFASAATGQTAQPPASLPPMPTLGTGQPNERRYTGNPVSMDFQGADLRAVLRTFAEISGLNVVIDPKVNGTVDVALRDVPWDQALDTILRANSLGYIVDGTIVRIAPLDALEAEQKKMTDLAKAQADAGQISTVTRQLSYAKGDEIVALLKSANILSNRGTAFVDARTNTLIVTDLADRLTNTTQLITTLDTPQPQVEIEARIVQISKTYARALGVQWGFNGRVDPALGNTTPLAFPNSGNLAGRAATGVQQPGPAGTAVNYSVPGAPTAVGLALGSINGAFNLDVALSALEQSGNARLLSTPRVTTQNNVSAEIAQGVQVPYQTVANNTVTTNFKDAALILKVTPQITAAQTVIMQISVDKGSVGESFNGVPSINTQRANTTVLVGDGQTTVIGGIYASDERSTADHTPGLGSIPLLKWLFKRDTLNDQSTELLIFITPRIIKS
jgi:type IV pilus assembly protein PilQ